VIAESLAVKICHKYFILPDGENTKKIIKGKAETETQFVFYGV
jgi:hypothetical protein